MPVEMDAQRREMRKAARKLYVEGTDEITYPVLAEKYGIKERSGRDFCR